MSVIGPRPQLVRDMVFMTSEQRMRHTAKPGLSGLAQVNGRNAISWEDKLEWDLRYIKKVSLFEDIKIIFKTVYLVYINRLSIIIFRMRIIFWSIWKNNSTCALRAYIEMRLLRNIEM